MYSTDYIFVVFIIIIQNLLCLPRHNDLPVYITYIYYTCSIISNMHLINIHYVVHDNDLLNTPIKPLTCICKQILIKYFI